MNNKGSMNIVLAGGSGQLGRVLGRHFEGQGHSVVVLSRKPRSSPDATAWRTVAWDAETSGPWTAEIDRADVVINLAGRSVDCRYTPANRRRIMDSRVRSTHVLGEAIARSATPPAVWLQSSTATIYAHRFDAPNDEATGILGGNEENVPDTWRFSVDVARAWEAAVDAAGTPETRIVKMRAAMVMSPDRGGVFDTLLGLVRRGLGGKAGSGRQFVSWIHEHDFVRAVDWLIARGSLAGAVNLAAPEPLPNADFMCALREAWGIRIGLPATAWMLAVGAFFLRTETELISKSRRVVPGRLLDDGFVFDHPSWPEAARELCRRYRRRP